MAVTHDGRTFDRVPRFDPRSRDYPIRGIVGPLADYRRTRVLWTPGPVILDQGAEGACVGMGCTQDLLASPVRVSLAAAHMPAGWPTDPDAFARHLYREAQKIDPWPGEAYDGTSVLAGVKLLHRLGFIREYRWAFTTDELLAGLLRVGPVVLGVWWYSGMYNAPGGWLRVTGQKVGGHCLLAIGYEPDHEFPDGHVGPAVALLNSWGPGWGVRGVAWIDLGDLSALLDDDGEACLFVGRRWNRNPIRRLLDRVLAAVPGAARG